MLSVFELVARFISLIATLPTPVLMFAICRNATMRAILIYDFFGKEMSEQSLGYKEDEYT